MAPSVQDTIVRRGWFHLPPFIILSLLAMALGCVRLASAENSRDTYRSDPEYLIDSWTTEDGLPVNYLSGMAQSADGFLWFTGPSGLLRFDGLRFTSVAPLPDPAPGQTSVTAVHVDARDQLWVGTRRGVARRTGHEWRLFDLATTNQAFGASVVQSFAGERDGNLFAITLAGEVFEFLQDQFRRLPPPPGTNAFPMSCVDGENNLWITRGDFIGHWDGRRWIEVIPSAWRTNFSDANAACAPARAGGVWLLLGDELCRWRGTSEVARVTLPGFKGLSPKLFEDSAGGVWIATSDNGLHRWQDGKLRRWSRSSGLPDNNVSFVREDAEKNIWVCTSRAGLSRFRLRVFQSFLSQTGPADNAYFSITPHPEGGVLVSTYTKRLARVDASGATNVPLSAELNSVALAARSVLVDRSGGIWLGALKDGVWILTTNGARHIPSEQSGGDNVNALFEDSHGRVWMAGGRGVAMSSSNETRSFGIPEGVTPGPVTSFAEDARGAVWFAQRQGVFRFENGRFTEVRDGAGKSLHAIALHGSADGSMWMSSLAQLTWRHADGRLFTAPLPAEWPVRGVGGFVEDGRGYFWMPTTRGVLRVRQNDLQSWMEGGRVAPVYQAFDQADGLPSLDCSFAYQPTTTRDAAGRLWFATRKGVAMVDPARFALNTVPPPVRIEGVSYFGESSAPHSSANAGAMKTQLSSPLPVRVIMPAGTRRVEIDYTACTFAAPAKARFQIKLNDGPDGWQDADDRRTAAFYDLRPGDYVFRVRAANDHGIWNETGASLAFVVRPFFWQTIWFRALAALALVGAGAGGGLWIARMRARHARAERERREISGRLITAQEDERKRIARDLHDDLNQRLALLSVDLELLGQETAGRSEAAHARLEEMAEGVKELSSDVHKLSYQLHPAKLDQLGLVAAARAFCRELARQSGWKIDFHHGEIPRDLDANLALCLYRVLQESLQNSVRHSGAKEARVELEIAGQEIRLVVSDQGRGFDLAAAERYGGLGLVSMKERVHQVGGTLTLESNASGTRVTVRAPVARAAS